MSSADTYLTKRVEVDLSEVISLNLEGFLDLLSERATDSPLLMDINYRVMSVENDILTIEVTGDTSAIEDEDLEGAE